MPRVSSRYEGLGVGFAPYLQPPGPGVVRWTVGEPGFDTPNEIIEAAIKSLQEGRTKYTRGAGTIELCQAVADYLQRHHGIEASAEDIVVTPGAKQAVLYSFLITTMPGDEAILLAPSWASYEPMLEFIGAVPVHVRVKFDNFHPDIEAIRAAVTDKTRMILINSPCNPTGAVFTPEEIQSILDIAIEHDLWIVSDEIYARMVWADWPHVSPATLPGGKERTIVVNGWSKSWAMTGMRLGFLTGPPEVVKAAVKSQANSASHVPTFVMEAARVALECDESVEGFNREYLKRRELMLEGLSSLPGLRVPEPEGAFYIFAEVTETGMSDIEFADGALEVGVQLIPASLISGGEGFIRVSYATDEEAIREGLRRLRTWLIEE
ncbi:MAG: pyridoxal phosphate-dependent aminotransferase [Candidatus Thalassarchaeaceae archaeon]|nr:aspartate aminotransferase [Euryarchaeota archaeon]MDP6220059.1 pyridoxal phosphate-dependent aminotransferase [Candidatus Thalassarchaeaceae archaeon]MBV43980.1 aspartate aminotransferase [Euryarchaeota archaeon]MDP7091246.1 pyridoxal phosphate-dependent aminotransferase [Candidatus Thalassarchaeaceae archaeon]MDP7256615.1 pyridoxal phosphate-dependent aminotransferase [Candidatus Thalassarchaeaceae archaeon]|tara:strand:- start:905 stop:2041 length:1137 start_codon:yes stop_codon:yes gene_type:complete